MNRILRIDTENLIAEVEPGLVTEDFQKAVEKLGLFYPPDPASLKFSTLGGNVAENAGGPRAVKYGCTKDFVMGLEVVLPDGRIIRTGGETYKGVVGYDLTKLVCGSEGTLGVVTKIILKLLPYPRPKRPCWPFLIRLTAPPVGLVDY
jgi:glycolate oxidase